MREIDINKYWIGYLMGILVFLNFFSAGIILFYTLNWNWIIFVFIYFGTLTILLPIKHLIKKQKIRERGV